MARNRSRRAPVRVPGFGLDPEKGAAISFTDEEIAYLRSQPIARVATLSADGQPDVVPLAFEFDGTFFWVGGSGPTVAATRKFRNVRAGNQKVGLVIDDLVSFNPFIARGIRIYGHADQPIERVGMVGPVAGQGLGRAPLARQIGEEGGQLPGDRGRSHRYPSPFRADTQPGRGGRAVQPGRTVR